MLALYLEAPFAVCRTFTAGWYRPTATFLTPSSAYGLLLNLAGIETRLREEDDQHVGKVPASLTCFGLPVVRLAIGAPAVRREGREWKKIESESDRFPRVQSLYQQLHNYPVGTSGNERAVTTFGNKYNITPVRREVLVGLRAVIAIDGNAEVEDRIRAGINGECSSDRYGLPFVGDNSFLPDRIEELDRIPSAHWFERATEEQAGIRPRTTRMTCWIDRADLSKTTSALYAPSDCVGSITPAAWTEILPPQ